MSWRPHPKHARTDPHNPQAWGTCDRSGFVHNLIDLVPEYEWSGTTLVDKHVLVGRNYVDVPNEQLRSIKLPPDPDPLFNARPEAYSVDEGLMPLTTEKGYPGDPGQVLRDENGQYIGVEPDTGGVGGSPFILGESQLGGPDVLGG